MALVDVADGDKSLTFTLVERSATLGEVAAMLVSEFGMLLLAALEESQRSEWSAPDILAHAEASLSEQRNQRDGRERGGARVDREMLAQLIADGFGWLISRGLVGPSLDHAGSATHWRPTSDGRAALTVGSPQHVEAAHRLHGDLHVALAASARPNFERGDYETAVFAAMKAVEVRVRERTGLPRELLGVPLMQQALKAGGPLAGHDAHPAEQVALMNLFMGAIGAFKNPASHRAVEYKSAEEAADILHLADLLLRVVDRQPLTRNE